jgi:hypothetical protein
MTNVIPFAPRMKHGQLAATERVAALPRPSLQIEHTAQNLLDAGTALERAVEALTEDGEWVPF